jgi:hypothetical protein
MNKYKVNKREKENLLQFLSYKKRSIEAIIIKINII